MLKIVLMDDEYYFRQAMKKYLSEIGEEYEVVGEGRNGKEGLALIENLQPDIAFVDINMPIMNGIEMTAELSEKKLKCKVIMVTGYGEFEYVRKAMKMGVQDYILKPVDIQELKDCLERVAVLINEERMRDARYEEWKKICMNPKQMDYLQEIQTIRNNQTLQPNKVACYIQDNCGRSDLNLDDIAKTFCVSRTVLCQQFKDAVKMTIGEYMNQTRMEKAKNMLDLGYQNISYISEMCGYEIPGYFSK